MKKTKLKEVVECRDCHDEKVCGDCSGTGRDTYIPGEECRTCGGDGRCQWCHEDEKK